MRHNAHTYDQQVGTNKGSTSSRELTIMNMEGDMNA
jgi:hypothetical protein